MMLELAEGTLERSVWMRLLKKPGKKNPDPTITALVSWTARKSNTISSLARFGIP